MRCGIDLGTTNSCIVVVGESGNTVIADENGNETFPSVVYLGREGQPVVGLTAKNRMGEHPAPVATIKRKMGSTETVMLGGKARSPVEISAVILGFLKRLAEKQSGRIIDRAVVTVPAYFDHIQRQHTDQAAREAGFREVVTLLEPVAAALAYSLESEREKLRIFVYDLGGGTFDATVLEKDPYGGLTVLSFGGDPYLGGDDIDARLAKLMLDRLKAQGYSLDLDPRRPEDFSRLQRLKFFAELAKKALTGSLTTQVVRQGLFDDRDGTTVDLDMEITRIDLEECCRDLIERTIEASLATLRKPGNEIALESIDEVIMVGGMSRMPLVQRLLGEATGHVPRVVNPDLIVGLGAAVKAAEVFAEQEVAASGLRLELRYDRRTDQPTGRIAGSFDRAVHDYTVFLLSRNDEMFQTVDGSDHFCFDSVILAPDSENVFTLSVEDSSERPVLQRQIRIVQDSKVSPVLVSPGSVVTKSIAIGVLDGLHVLFPENTALPHTSTHQFETADQSGRIVAPILEGDREVERLEIRDIPTTLPTGTPVMVTVSIFADYHIEAHAAIPQLKREVKIEFQIKPVDTSRITPEFVTARLAELEAKARRAVEQCPSPDAVASFEFRASTIKDEIEMELREIEPKAAKLQEKLAALELQIHRLPAPVPQTDLRPTYEEFNERLAAIMTAAIESQHSRLAEMSPQIEQLRTMARNAWHARDPLAWRRVNDQLSSAASILQPEISPRERTCGMAAWVVTDQVPEMREKAAGRFEKEIAIIENAATRVFHLTQNGSMDPASGASELIDLYHQQVVPLRKRLGLQAEEQPAVASAPTAGEGILRAARGV